MPRTDWSFCAEAGIEAIITRSAKSERRIRGSVCNGYGSEEQHASRALFLLHDRQENHIFSEVVSEEEGARVKNAISYFGVSLFVITALACRKEPAQSQPGGPDTASVSAAATDTQVPAAPASSSYDLQFLDAMSKHHGAAVEMAKMAQGKIEQSQLKELVAKIPGDQQKEIDQMKAWREQWYPGAASTETMQMPGMNSSESKNMDMSHIQSMKPGRDYDLMFMDMMIPHHEEAITMSRDALTKAQHQEVKTLAQQIIDAQTKEVDQMKKWKEALKDGQAHKR